jgi:DNA-binding transcriptional ArsR family regulator
MTSLDETLSALSDPHRRGVVDLLRARPRPAGELARALRLRPSAMSRHLGILRKSGLIEEDHQGEDARIRTYRLRPEPFNGLRRWVEEVEAFWGLELQAFKTHVETKHGKGRK